MSNPIKPHLRLCLGTGMDGKRWWQCNGLGVVKVARTPHIAYMVWRDVRKIRKALGL